jgi:chemotaxis protein CheX
MSTLEDSICEITENVWSSVLGLPVTRTIGLISEPGITGCVQIAGAWQGAVILRCGAELADRAATIVFETEATTKDQLQDVLAELSNMMGGNIKALMAEPSRLSLPTVIDGTNYLARMPGSRLVSELAFDCEGHRFLVTVLEKDPEQESPVA